MTRCSHAQGMSIGAAGQLDVLCRTSTMLCARETAPGVPSKVISVGSLLWSIWMVDPENCELRFAAKFVSREVPKRAPLACQTVAGWQRTSCSALIVSPPLHARHNASNDSRRLHACVGILSDGEPGRARSYETSWRRGTIGLTSQSLVQPDLCGQITAPP